ncbi:hypothetical protein E8E11_007079 [Didymella keratinophila]|nr:hypothetical protein E8E11_007079 [Didymella keratinophila]
MAPPKRKRKLTRTTTNKRPKYTLPDTDSSSGAEEDPAPDSQEEWEAVRILEQRGKGFALQYLIEWKDIDPATGEPWAPTWERASNAGAVLRASWKAELARLAQEKKEATAAARCSTQQRSAREESPAQVTQSRGARHSRVVESPAPSESANAADPSTETRQSPAAIASSTTIDLEAPIPDWTSPQVNIDVRGDSFNRGEYEPFSEVLESQSSPEKSVAEGTTLESSQLFASQPAFLAFGIVRETQSSAGDVSYIPVTQEELESSLHSNSSDECSEDHIIGYSGLLDTDEAPKLGARPHSPATSIAETVADTTQEFHSQRQLDSQQERSGISDTLESHSLAISGNADLTDNRHHSDSSHQTEADLTQSQDSAGPLQAEFPSLFVENTTQFDHESSVPEREELPQERNEDDFIGSSSVAASTSTAADQAASHSNNALVLPSINISAEGTRSPSTVPDRSPAPPSNAPLGTVPAASSLRSVAFANKVTEPLMIDSLLPKHKTVDKPSVEKDNDLVPAAAAAAAQSVPAGPSSPAAHDDIENLHDVSATHDVDDMDDYDDDYDDPYDDELKLDDEEYIVPLYIEGRQRDTYTEYIKQKTDLFNEVYVHGQASIEEFDKVDRALNYLKAIETHPDLTYAEAESAIGSGLHSLADVQHGAQFGIDNSVKFKFLGHLFKQIRDKSMHVVLLLDQNNDALFNIVKTFLTAGQYNFKMPTKRLQSTVSSDSLMITVFPKSVLPVIQAVHLIICLDGVQNAAQARQRKAPAAGKTIPVFHMVIPQTVGHIERYMLPTTDRRTRIETILAGLAKAQDGNQVGNAIDINTPSAEEAAQMITSWLFPNEGEESTEWPLPSIGSAKSLIEWDATQQSARSAASSPAPERTKRTLDEDDFDRAKRMRYTPQPPVVTGSNTIHEPEVTRISDSMSGTAASENARLAASLDKVSTVLLQERKDRREEAVMWDRQQTEHENRQEQYRKLFNEKAAVDRELAAMTAIRDQLRSKIEAQLAEVRRTREELEALRALNLISPDEKNVGITRLRKELEDAKLELAKARSSAKTQDETMDFLKEQYRKAQVVAGQAQSEVETLTSTNAKLSQQASGEAAKLKQMHIDRSAKNMMQQNKALQSENAVLKARLKAIEEELARAKNNSGRSAYGTRGQSTTPQPKTRSRAASPTGGPRVARGGGRISNLVAEGM